MIVGLVPTPALVESLLNNLDEADYDLKQVSVILADAKLRRKIAKNVGPLKGISPVLAPQKLVALGLDAADALTIADGLKQGSALVVVNVPVGTETNATEMFHDEQATFVKVIP